MSKADQALETRLAGGIADKIRTARVEAGLSQEQLGERARLHRTYIGAVERGEKNITVVTLAKIARALRCGLADLLPEDSSAN